MAGDAEQRVERSDCARGDNSGASLSSLHLGRVNGDVGEAERVYTMLEEGRPELAWLDQLDRVVAQDRQHDTGKACPAANVEP